MHLVKPLQLSLLTTLLLTALPSATKAEQELIGAASVSSAQDVRSAVLDFVSAAAPQMAVEVQAQTDRFLEQLTSLGLDLNSEIAGALFRSDDPTKPAFGLVLPVRDPGNVKANQALNITPSATDPDLFTLTFPGVSEQLFAIFVETKMIVSTSDRLAKSLQAPVATDSLTSALRAGGGQIALGLSFDRVWEWLRPEIDRALSKEESDATAAAGLSMVKSWLAPIDEVKGVAFRLNIQSTHINISIGVTPKPETELAKTLLLNEKQAVQATGLLPINPVFYFQSSMDVSESGQAKMTQLIETLFEQIGALSQDMFTAEQVSALKALNVEYLRFWDGTFAGTLQPSQTQPATVGVYGHKSREAVISYIKAMPGLFEQLSSGEEPSIFGDYKIKQQTQVNGFDLIELDVTFAEVVTASNPFFAGMEDLETAYLVTDNSLLFAQGANATQTLTELADKVGEPGVYSITPKLYGFGENPGLFFAASLARFGAFTLSQEVPEASGTPGFAFSLDAVNGAAEIQLYIAAREIAELIALQTAMMMEKVEQEPQPTDIESPMESPANPSEAAAE